MKTHIINLNTLCGQAGRFCSVKAATALLSVRRSANQCSSVVLVTVCHLNCQSLISCKSSAAPGLVSSRRTPPHCVGLRVLCREVNCMSVPHAPASKNRERIRVLFDIRMNSSIHLRGINPSVWGHLNPSSYCDVGRLFYGVFKLWSKLQRKK